ncbi:MAG: trypsin-like peptidase domain-containing protein [Gammaproteobacteria bacterium]|nr:trypsin-like peptidase domain-containing protein [Gammaproteobacteria bacterium]
MRSLARIAPILLTGAAHAALPDAVDGQPLPSLAPMLERTTAGVVNVATFARVQSYPSPLMRDPFFRRFFQLPEQRRAQSAGSGVIVDARTGHIVTNHHLVADAHEIHVRLSDGREFPADLVGVDPQVDLAVLRIAAHDLTQLPFGKSQGLRVGDFVIAIGNPFGLEQTVTSGIVSALGRSGLRIEGYQNFIQTDASINPGNSGGALVDLNGRLVGINTAIVATTGGNIGIGFAIPSDLVGSIMGEIIEHGTVRRGRIGVTVAALNAQLAKVHGVAETEGIVVTEIVPGSAADTAGIRRGDIVASIDGRPMLRPGDYGHQEAVTMVGDELDVEIIRNGRRMHLAVSIDLNWSVAGARLHPRLEGAVLIDVRYEDEPNGIAVSSIERTSPAWATGLRPGDILLAANNQTTRHIGELARQLINANRVVLRVARDGRIWGLRL